MQVDPLIYYFYYIVFLLSKCQLRDRFTPLLHLHEKFAREYVCVRAYVCRGCCNIKRELKWTLESGWSGRDYGGVKSFDLSRSTTKPTK